MSHKESKLNAERLRELLDYNPNTGVFNWKSARRGVSKDQPVGCCRMPDRQVIIGVDGLDYRAHRLAWLHVHGEWPTKEIDHINCDRTDNRLANLRLATRSQNNANRAGPTTKGTCRNKGGTWMARIKFENVVHYLGNYSSQAEAREAYERAAKTIHGVFSNLTVDR